MVGFIVLISFVIIFIVCHNISQKSIRRNPDCILCYKGRDKKTRYYSHVRAYAHESCGKKHEWDKC